jgi:hypothetical protein
MAPRRYKAVLAEFMSFLDASKYDESVEFSKNRLLGITPDDVCRWMNVRAFGEPEPSDEMKPLYARSTTLEFAKKAVSSFMPRIRVVWDPVRMEGNPTRSDEVNKLIKKSSDSRSATKA